MRFIQCINTRLGLFPLQWFVPAVFAAIIMAGAGTATAGSGSQVLVEIGKIPITAEVFGRYYDRARRRKFYHGAPPGEREAAFRREVAAELISRVLLLQEAERRGLKPDWKKVQALLARYDKRYAGNVRWQREREQLLGALQNYAEEDDLLSQLEAQVRRIQPPTKMQLQAYYRANPDKFTEPARKRVSLILLRVPPSSPPQTWDAARSEARKLLARLHQGADFAELARLHSGDRTAQNGGDMGYLHKGMLAGQAEQAVEKLAIGEISDPVTVLEGIAIFRLAERRPEKLQPFTGVRGRAQELWLREKGETAWQALQHRLRASTSIKVYDQSLLPQPPV